LRAQIFLDPNNIDPLNSNPGSDYFTGSIEIGAVFDEDSGFESYGNLSIQGSLYNSNNVTVYNLVAPGITYSPDPGQFTSSLWGSFEVSSGFSPGVSEAWGLGGSWLHGSLDLSDLTYTSTDTPAFNISQLSTEGQLYPTVYFTGYDSNTTWVWQQNGLVAQGNTGPLRLQMALSGNGNLTLYNPDNSRNVRFSPETGGLVANYTSARLSGNSTSSNQFSIVTGNNTIVFTTGNSSTTLAPSDISGLYSGPRSIGIGANNTIAAEQAYVFGNNLNAYYDGSIVMGAANALPSSFNGTSTNTWEAGDPLFVIGDGDALNAITVLKSGDVILGGNATISGNVTLDSADTVFTEGINFVGNVTLAAPQGDIPNAE